MGDEALKNYTAGLFRLFGQNVLLQQSRCEQELKETISEQVTRLIQMKLNLTLITQPTNNNTCFVTANGEIREEFKQFITITEFFYFLYGAYLDRSSRNVVCWPDILPNDTAVFWSQVRSGEKEWLSKTS